MDASPKKSQVILPPWKKWDRSYRVQIKRGKDSFNDQSSQKYFCTDAKFKLENTVSFNQKCFIFSLPSALNEKSTIVNMDSI